MRGRSGDLADVRGVEKAYPSKDRVGFDDRIDDHDRVVAPNDVQQSHSGEKTLCEIEAVGRSESSGSGLQFGSQAPDGVKADPVVAVEVVAQAEDEFSYGLSRRGRVRKPDREGRSDAEFAPDVNPALVGVDNFFCD